MNIELAKSIAISEILGKLNLLPKSTSGKELRYLSPFRNERTPSFFVNVNENLWFDHGEGIGGDLVRFACIYLERHNEAHTVSDALRWISNLSNDFPVTAFVPARKERSFEKEDSPLSLKSNRPLTNIALIRYLDKRGIPQNLAKQHLRELQVFNSNSGKRITCLGFPNEDGGFELRNPFFKACLRPKSISFIRGRVPKPEGIHLFEGFMDYLSAIVQLNGRSLKADSIILNSLSCAKEAMAYIHKYGYRIAYTWMDNDPAGQKATEAFAEFFKSEEGLCHAPMNSLYADHKDVNAWHMHHLRLT